VRGDAARRGDRGRAELRHDPALEHAFVEQPVRLDRADRVDDDVVQVEPRHVGEEHQLPRAEAERERGRGVVGVHVQRADCDGRDDRHEAVRERPEDRRRAARQRVADPAERRHRHGVEAGLVADHRDGDLAEGGAELGVHGDERLAHDLERLARGAAAPVHELDADAAALHLVGDLRAGAVHDDDLVALLAQAEDPVGRLAGDRAAHLDDETRHER